MPSRVEPWSLANEYPATSLPGEGDTLFCRLVAEKTGGTLSIRAVADSGMGYKSREQLRAVAEGRIAMADTFSGALGEVDPLFALSTRPFAVASIAEARDHYRAARPNYDAAFARHNQKLLFSTPWPASGLWTHLPIHSVEDLASLKIRTYDDSSARLFARLGASAAEVSFVDLDAKIATGEIQAALSSGDGGAGRTLRKHFRHFTAIDYAMPLSFTTINLDLWNSLDTGTRGHVAQAALETEARQWSAIGRRVEENHARMRESGVTIAIDIPAALHARLREAAAER